MKEKKTKRTLKPRYYWEETELYPIAYNGKLYNEEDCDDIFVAFYHCKEALNAECGVYLAEGIWVYPDVSMGEWLFYNLSEHFKIARSTHARARI